MRKPVILRGRPHTREELKRIFGMSEKDMREVDQIVARMRADDLSDQSGQSEAPSKPAPRRRRTAA